VPAKVWLAVMICCYFILFCSLLEKLWCSERCLNINWYLIHWLGSDVMLEQNGRQVKGFGLVIYWAADWATI
jgi:hypothetical protein